MFYQGISEALCVSYDRVQVLCNAMVKITRVKIELATCSTVSQSRMEGFGHTPIYSYVGALRRIWRRFVEAFVFASRHKMRAALPI